MHCDGNCFLLDQLAKTVQQDQQSTPATPTSFSLRDYTPHQVAQFNFQFDCIAIAIAIGTSMDRNSQLLTGMVPCLFIPPDSIA